jgi:hypothetical protein
VAKLAAQAIRKVLENADQLDALCEAAPSR